MINLGFDYILLGLVTLSILFYKSNFIKINLVIFIYPVWIVCFTKNDIYMPGIISAIGLDYYKEYLSTAFWWALIGAITFLICLWDKRNETVTFKTLAIEEKTRIGLVLVTAVSGALFLPKVFFLSGERFNLLPFFAWGALYNMMSIFLVMSHRKFSHLSSLLHLILLLFIVSRGERADQIMVLLSLFLFTGESQKTERKINYKFLITVVAMFLVVSFIGFIRIIGFNNFINNFSLYFGMSFYAQQTAVDVTHVYMSSVYYYFEEPFNFSVLGNLPLSLLPGMPGGGSSAHNNYINVLEDVVPSYGGGLFYSESAMNFGLIGIIVYVLFLSSLIRYGFSASSLTRKVVLFSLLILVFRVHWYGFLYILKPIYISSLLILFLLQLSRRMNRQSRKI